jgi:hypothetical protein
MAPVPSTAAPVPSRAYAGIGSRETPPDVLALMEALAEKLAGEGFRLRTGLSPGADQAFYRGALRVAGEIELYLPWPSFEAEARADAGGDRVLELPQPSAAAFELSRAFHPQWETLELTERRLLARDAHELLGADLKSPAQLVVCWTADGSRDGRELFGDGTGQALRIAHHHGVPVRNLARPQDAEELLQGSLARDWAG